MPPAVYPNWSLLDPAGNEANNAAVEEANENGNAQPGFGGNTVPGSNNTTQTADTAILTMNSTTNYRPAVSIPGSLFTIARSTNNEANKAYLIEHRNTLKALSPEKYGQDDPGEDIRIDQAVYNEWRQKIGEAGRLGVVEMMTNIAAEEGIRVGGQTPADIGDIQSYISNPASWQDVASVEKSWKFIYKIKYGCWSRDSHWINEKEKSFCEHYNVLFDTQGNNNCVTVFHRIMMSKKGDISKRIARSELRATGMEVRDELGDQRFWEEYWRLPIKGEHMLFCGVAERALTVLRP